MSINVVNVVVVIIPWIILLWINSNLFVFLYILTSHILIRHPYVHIQRWHNEQITQVRLLLLTHIQQQSTGTRRVRFKCDENGSYRTSINLPKNRPTLSSEDVRLAQKNSTHRVEFQIPIHKDINPWLNVDCSVPPKIRSLTSQKIDIKYSNNNNNNNNLVHLQDTGPNIQAEITSQSPSMGDSDKNQSQWYRQMYSNLHKPPGSKLDYQRNSYKPTYVFPDDFNGDSDFMEDHIRRKATKTNDKDNRKVSFSPVQTLTSSLKDHRTPSKRNNGHIEKVTRFEDRYMSPVHSSSTERQKTVSKI
ncbi:hypothetical protein I4U23_020799 [Adineta vaga]|nr:hypothetical protein I4U23_020799 [Adineta vaga]